MAGRRLQERAAMAGFHGRVRAGLCSAPVLLLMAVSAWGFYLVGRERARAVESLGRAGVELEFGFGLELWESDDDWPWRGLWPNRVNAEEIHEDGPLPERHSGQGGCRWADLLLALRGLQPVWAISIPAVAEERGPVAGRERTVGDGVLRRLRYFPENRCLVLWGSGVTDRHLDYLAGQPWLEKLDLSYTKITDAGLARLSHLRRLRVLDLDGTELMGEGFRHLRSLKRLEVLRARLPLPRQEAVVALADLGSAVKLRRLYLTGFADVGRALKGMQDLEVLSLFSHTISEETLEHIGGLRCLKSLELMSPISPRRISDDALRHLARARSLERLQLRWTDIRGRGLVHVCSLPRLRELWIEEESLFKDEVPFLPTVPTLRVLVLDRLSWSINSRPGDAVMEWVARHGFLRELSLRYMGITDEGLRKINMPRLEWLDLKGNEGITDVGLSQLAALPELQGLVLVGTAISDGGLKELRKFPKLEVLKLSDTRVTDAGLGYLKGLRHLKYVSLPATQVTEQGVEQLRKAMPPTFRAELIKRESSVTQPAVP